MASERLRATLLGVILAAVPLSGHLAAQVPAPGPEAATQATPPAAPAPTAEALARARTRIATALDGALVDTQNGDDLMLETSGYRRLLQLVAAVPPAEATQRTTRDLDRAASLKDPDALRGEWVRVRGLLIGLRAERLDRPIDAAVDVWEGVVSDTDASDGVVFDMLEKPEGFNVGHDIVDVEGVFYRTARYENKAGKVVDAPYLIVRNVLHSDTSALPVVGIGGGPFPLIIIGAGVAFVVVRLVMMIRDRSKASSGRGEASLAIRRAAEQHLRQARATRPPGGNDSSLPHDPPAKPS